MGDDVGDGFRPVDRVIGQGDPQRVGRFRFFLDGQRWEWSEPVARMHGYESEAVVPDTRLLLEHKHPDDRDHVAAVLERVREGEPFSSRHRIIDTHGHTHWVVVVGDRMVDAAGMVIGTSGFYIDVTRAVQSDVSIAVSEIAASRAEIEQAKGVLMLAYGISADRAFDVLVWRSQETNMKVRELARHFMAAIAHLRLAPRTVEQLDRVLLTPDGA